MRITSVGTVLIISSISFALCGIFFSNISWILVGCSIACIIVYAHQRAVHESENIDLDIERTVLDEMPFVHEPIALRLDILNKCKMPIEGEIEDIVPPLCDLRAGSNRFSGVLPPRSKLTINYSLAPKKRGNYVIRGIRFEKKDSFGLFVEERFLENKTVINVQTERKSIHAAKKLAAREHLEFSGIARHFALVMRDMEFDSIRDYEPGDRSRDIHWKQLSKTGRLMTKIFRKEGALQTTLFLDSSRSMRSTGEGINKLDYSIDLLIQFSNILLSNFYSVGVGIVDELSLIDNIPPATGKKQFERIVRLLRKTPMDIEGYRNSSERLSEPIKGIRSRSLAGDDNEIESSEFLRVIEGLISLRRAQKLGTGLEGAILNSIATNRRDKSLFIIISDLIASREAVLRSAKICQHTKNKILIIHVYEDWFEKSNGSPELTVMERYCNNMVDFIELEVMLKRLGASYLRIGPADITPTIVRTIRRGGI